ncbi:hypothetical protein BLJAPNOD_06400 [Ensifer sp. M14]|nr:hypothetical protein BLJAPNOD_06400 [Ensifer sp. M14]
MTFVAEDDPAACGCPDEIVALAAGQRLLVFATSQNVVAVATEDQIQAHAAVDDVVAGLALDDVGGADIGAAVGDDVVAVAAMKVIDTEAALDAVVAAIPPDRVVAGTTDQRFAGIRAAEDDMLATGKSEIVRCPHHQRGCAGDGGDNVGVAGRIGIAKAVVVLPGLVHFDDVISRLERGAIGMHTRIFGVGVAPDQIGEAVAFQFVEQVLALCAAQIVEAVTVLQVLDLQFEHVGEGGAEHAAERHQSFGKAPDPEIDLVETGFRVRPATGRVEIIKAFLTLGGRLPGNAEDQIPGGIALGLCSRGCRDRIMRAICGDEVDDRQRVLDVLSEVGPARIGL